MLKVMGTVSLDANDATEASRDAAYNRNTAYLKMVRCDTNTGECELGVDDKSTNSYEVGLLNDWSSSYNVPQFFYNKVIPALRYTHDSTWNDYVNRSFVATTGANPYLKHQVTQVGSTLEEKLSVSPTASIPAPYIEST